MTEHNEPMRDSLPATLQALDGHALQWAELHARLAEWWAGRDEHGDPLPPIVALRTCANCGFVWRPLASTSTRCRMCGSRRAA